MWISLKKINVGVFKKTATDADCIFHIGGDEIVSFDYYWPYSLDCLDVSAVRCDLNNNTHIRVNGEIFLVDDVTRVEERRTTTTTDEKWITYCGKQLKYLKTGRVVKSVEKRDIFVKITAPIDDNKE